MLSKGEAVRSTRTRTIPNPDNLVLAWTSLSRFIGQLLDAKSDADEFLFLLPHIQV